MCPECKRLTEELEQRDREQENDAACIREIEGTNDTLTKDNARLRQQNAELRAQVQMYKETGNDLTAILTDTLKNGGKRKALRMS
jgi:hypothetical protein